MFIFNSTNSPEPAPVFSATKEIYCLLENKTAVSIVVSFVQIPSKHRRFLNWKMAKGTHIEYNSVNNTNKYQCNKNYFCCPYTDPSSQSQSRHQSTTMYSSLNTNGNAAAFETGPVSGRFAAVYSEVQNSRIDHALPLPSVLRNPFKVVEGPPSSAAGNPGSSFFFFVYLHEKCK